MQIFGFPPRGVLVEGEFAATVLFVGLFSIRIKISWGVGVMYGFYWPRSDLVRVGWDHVLLTSSPSKIIKIFSLVFL